MKSIEALPLNKENFIDDSIYSSYNGESTK